MSAELLDQRRLVARLHDEFKDQLTTMTGGRPIAKSIGYSNR